MAALVVAVSAVEASAAEASAAEVSVVLPEAVGVPGAAGAAAVCRKFDFLG